MVNPSPFLLPISLQDGLFCRALPIILRRIIPCIGASPMDTITHPTLVQLAAQRSKRVRVFRKLDTLVLYLQQIGVSRFEVDAAGFIVFSRPQQG